MPFDLVVRARRSLRADDARGSRVVARSTPATNDDDDGDVETILDHPFRRASRDLRTRRVVFAASIESRARARVVVVVAAAALLARRDIESIASDVPAPSPSPSPQTGRFIPEKSNIWRDCVDGYHDWVKEHIAEGAPLDESDHCGDPPMLLAAGNGHTAVCDLLINEVRAI